MKRLGLVVVLLACGLLSACADTTIRSWTLTVAWDAPTMDLLPDDTVTYRVYLENVLTGARLMLGSTPALQYAVTVPSRASWRVGVSTLVDESESEIAWSNVEADVRDGVTFLVRPAATAVKPAELRVE